MVGLRGNVDVEGGSSGGLSGNVAAETVRLTPLDAGRTRVFLAPLGLYLTLDAGTVQAVEIRGPEVRLTLSPATSHTPVALLRVEHPGVGDDQSHAALEGSYEMVRGAYRLPLGQMTTDVVLRIR